MNFQSCFSSNRLILVRGENINNSDLRAYAKAISYNKISSVLKFI